MYAILCQLLDVSRQLCSVTWLCNGYRDMDLKKNTYIIKESITVTDNTLHRH
jgi:hypothetical protein